MAMDSRRGILEARAARVHPMILPIANNKTLSKVFSIV